MLLDAMGGSLAPCEGLPSYLSFHTLTVLSYATELCFRADLYFCQIPHIDRHDVPARLVAGKKTVGNTYGWCLLQSIGSQILLTPLKIYRTSDDLPCCVAFLVALASLLWRRPAILNIMLSGGLTCMV